MPARLRVFRSMDEAGSFPSFFDKVKELGVHSRAANGCEFDTHFCKKNLAELQGILVLKWQLELKWSARVEHGETLRKLLADESSKRLKLDESNGCKVTQDAEVDSAFRIDCFAWIENKWRHSSDHPAKGTQSRKLIRV